MKTEGGDKKQCYFNFLLHLKFKIPCNKYYIAGNNNNIYYINT